MADGKWISGLSPDTPLADSARHVLEVRLAVVAQQLPRVLTHSQEDSEHVHQLRVATRRADAALRIFRGCLHGKVYKSARARLRSLRQAAGAARDWDVFLIEIEARAEKAPSEERPGLDFLVGYGLGQRHAAQAGLDALAAGAGCEFEGFATGVVDAVRNRQPHAADGPEGGGVGGKGTHALVDLARPTLAGLLHELEAAATGNLKDYDHLHRVRILGKRLRYAMEVFAGCFPPAFRVEHYPRVEEMQELLGRANDSHVAARRLTDLRAALGHQPAAVGARLGVGVDALLKFHRRRLPLERRKFERWWAGWRAGAAHLLDGADSRQPAE